MKHYRAFFAAVLACFFAVASAFAAEASPAGTWTWSAGARQGKEIAITLKLDYANGKLSGLLLAPSGGQFPDTPIADASFEGGVVRFQVKREASGLSVTTRFEGKLEGDTLKGTTERTTEGGKGSNTTKREWTAHRKA